MRNWHARSPSRNFLDVPRDIGSASLSGVVREQVGECWPLFTRRWPGASEHALANLFPRRREADGWSEQVCCAAAWSLSLDVDAPASDSWPASLSSRCPVADGLANAVANVWLHSSIKFRSRPNHLLLLKTFRQIADYAYWWR